MYKIDKAERRERRRLVEEIISRPVRAAAPVPPGQAFLAAKRAELLAGNARLFKNYGISENPQDLDAFWEITHSREAQEKPAFPRHFERNAQ